MFHGIYNEERAKGIQTCREGKHKENCSKSYSKFYLSTWLFWRYQSYSRNKTKTQKIKLCVSKKWYQCYLLGKKKIVPHFPLLRAPWNKSYFTVFMEKDTECYQGSDSKWQSQAYPTCASLTLLCFLLGIRLTETSPYSVSRIWKPRV